MSDCLGLIIYVYVVYIFMYMCFMCVFVCFFVFFCVCEQLYSVNNEIICTPMNIEYSDPIFRIWYSYDPDFLYFI